MAAPQRIAPGEYVPTADQRIVMRARWEHYEAELALRGDRSTPRISYLDGVMELMSRSKDHERFRSYIGRLIEAFALVTGVDLSPYGSWTLKNALKEAGVEPDECYLIGPDQQRTTPDLAIEVIWTSGGIDKLEAYRRLGVREVWFWRKGEIEIHVRRADVYELSERSEALPGLDVKLLASFLDKPTAMQAVKAFRAALGESSG